MSADTINYQVTGWMSWWVSKNRKSCRTLQQLLNLMTPRHLATFYLIMKTSCLIKPAECLCINCNLRFSRNAIRFVSRNVFTTFFTRTRSSLVRSSARSLVSWLLLLEKYQLEEWSSDNGIKIMMQQIALEETLGSHWNRNKIKMLDWVFESKALTLSKQSNLSLSAACKLFMRFHKRPPTSSALFTKFIRCD